MLLMFSWYGRALRPPSIEQIPIEIFATPEKATPPPAVGKSAPGRSAPPPAKAPRETTRNEKLSRTELPPGQPAKIDRDGADAPPKKITKSEPPIAKKSPVEEEETKSPRVATAENGQAVIQQSPTLEELLPPGIRIPGRTNRQEQTPVRLDSRDPRYVDYLSRVRQAIKSAWFDPTVAPSVVHSFGIEATLIVSFKPGQNGDLEQLYVVRTSGYSMIDQEALRVVAAAAPNFGRPPKSLGPVTIKFIYERDNVSYSFTPQ